MENKKLLKTPGDKSWNSNFGPWPILPIKRTLSNNSNEEIFRYPNLSLNIHSITTHLSCTKLTVNRYQLPSRNKRNCIFFTCWELKFLQCSEFYAKSCTLKFIRNGTENDTKCRLNLCPLELIITVLMNWIKYTREWNSNRNMLE